MVESNEQAQIQIKVSVALVNGAIGKLKLNPSTPATYVVDNVMRLFLEK